jgi:TolB-like protein/DNA-binding winged helix-turn-helix (wHTH) protein/Flp pilus assembly protein TadD
MKPANDGHAPGTGAENGRYCFDTVVVDEAAHTLIRDGQPQPIEPKAFAVLLALLRRPGELLPRDELLDSVWGHRHVTPGVLTRAIAQLRSALDDDSQRPRYIQTQHALGYRFIGTLRPEHADEAETAPAEAKGGPSDDVMPVEPLDDPDPIPPSTGELDGRRPSARFQRWHGWLAVAVLLLVGVMGWKAWQPPASTAARVTPSIAVMPFTSVSDNPQDTYFAEGLAVEMHDALASVPGLTVAARLRDPDAFQRSDVKAIGKAMGVATLLDATVRRDGDRIRVNARLSDTATGDTVWNRHYDRALTDVFGTQSEIAEQVVQSLLGALPDMKRDLAARLAPTRNLAAFDAYLRGLHALQGSAGKPDSEGAIGYFNQALVADSGFARAQVGLCRSQLSRFRILRDAEAFNLAQQACLKVRAMDPALGEVNLALGDLQRVQGNGKRAIALYRKAEEDPSLRPEASLGLGLAYAELGDRERAVEYLERAIALRPGNASAYSELGYLRYLNDDVPGAIAAYEQATLLRPGSAGLWSTLGALYFYMEDLPAADRALDRSMKIEPTDGALNNLGTLRFHQGDHAGAAEMFLRATRLSAGDFLIWGNLGDALRANPATVGESRAAYLKAATMAQPYLELKPSDARAMASLAWYSANLGEDARARELLARAEALGTERAEVALLNAQTLRQLGDEAGAQQRLAAARSAGIRDIRIRQNASLAPAPQALAGRTQAP